MTRLPLSDAKARLSEVVRSVRQTQVPVVVTVDGEPAVQIVPVTPAPTRLSPHEVATYQALMGAVLALDTLDTPYDAVAAVVDGRR